MTGFPTTYFGYPMFMFEKRKANAKSLFNAQVISIAKFTFEAWKKSFPISDIEDWQNIMCPDDTSKFVFDNVGLIGRQVGSRAKSFPNIRIVPLDEEYIKWCQENNKNFKMKDCVDYINSLKDADVERLFTKNGWDVNYTLFGIPIYIISNNLSNKREYKLPENVKEELFVYLSSIYGKDSVFLSNYVLKMDDYYNNPGPFLNMARGYFEDGSSIRLNRWDVQEFDDENANVFPFIIPFATKHTHTSPVFDVKQLLTNPKTSNDCFGFMQEEFLCYGIKDAEPFVGSKAEKEMMEYFAKEKDACFIMPYAIPLRLIPEEAKQTAKFIKKYNVQMRGSSHKEKQSD